MVEIRNLSKHYGKKQVLNKVNLSVKAGEVLGVLGPNGAGKTTLLKTICGLVLPGNGEVILNGVSSNQIATIFEDQHFLGYLSGISNMKLFLRAIYRKRFSLDETFQQYGLEESKKVKFKFYSSGMKKRMDLMSVFVSGKRLYLLDEPTNGLDIDGMIAFNQQVITLKNEGKSFIIASHHSLELEKIGDFFLFIDRGAVVGEMSREELLQKFDSLESAYRLLIPTPLNQKFLQP